METPLLPFGLRHLLQRREIAQRSDLPAPLTLTDSHLFPNISTLPILTEPGILALPN
ncbi:hypothetical protein [Calothrix rhizosoleniae]|uniref:hypothetical protein n=1 Tax=Calothrix rhizosoleniae TaxID=888997 RepID=UPI001356362E|nr:hypothetical protein [Calothrix rhizosoleniae]